MRIKPLVVIFSGFLVSACAGTTPPPRFSALDPADAKAPESVAVPQAPLLDLPAEHPGAAPAASEAMPMGHDHHMEAPSGDAPPSADVYSCPMHPQAKEPKPGKCPICGEALVKRPSKTQAERQP